MAKTLDIWMLGNDSFNEFTQYPDTDDASAYPLTQDQKELIKTTEQELLSVIRKLLKTTGCLD